MVTCDTCHGFGRVDSRAARRGSRRDTRSAATAGSPAGRLLGPGAAGRRASAIAPRRRARSGAQQRAVDVESGVQPRESRCLTPSPWVITLCANRDQTPATGQGATRPSRSPPARQCSASAQRSAAMPCAGSVCARRAGGDAEAWAPQCSVAGRAARDEYAAAVRRTLADAGVNVLRLPARSPNLSPYAERWVCSIPTTWRTAGWCSPRRRPWWARRPATTSPPAGARSTATRRASDGLVPGAARWRTSAAAHRTQRASRTPPEIRRSA